VEERQLDEQFPPGVKGRALCLAAGNDGGSLRHARVQFAGQADKGVLTWAAPAGGQLRVFIDPVAPADADDVAAVVIGCPGFQGRRYLHPLSGSLVLEIEIVKGSDLGGQLELFSKSGKSLRADAFLPDTAGLSGFIGRCRDRSCLLDAPGTAARAITVASYDFNDQFERGGKTVGLLAGGRPFRVGVRSDYSSPGYPRRGAPVKPDVTAPGRYFTAPAAAGMPPGTRDTSGKYLPFAGTSAATPYAAGVIALMFERKPDLTLDEVKALLRDEATKDAQTGATPNPGWGHGKLDRAAVLRVLGRLR
jgi:subtilisin family serine protease